MDFRERLLWAILLGGSLGIYLLFVLDIVLYPTHLMCLWLVFAVFFVLWGGPTWIQILKAILETYDD